MHNESLMVAGGLAVVAVLFAAQKNKTCTRIGMIIALVSGVMVMAGLSG